MHKVQNWNGSERYQVKSQSVWSYSYAHLTAAHQPCPSPGEVFCLIPVGCCPQGSHPIGPLKRETPFASLSLSVSSYSRLPLSPQPTPTTHIPKGRSFDCSIYTPVMETMLVHQICFFNPFETYLLEFPGGTAG